MSSTTPSWAAAQQLWTDIQRQWGLAPDQPVPGVADATAGLMLRVQGHPIVMRFVASDPAQIEWVGVMHPDAAVLDREALADLLELNFWASADGAGVAIDAGSGRVVLLVRRAVSGLSPDDLLAVARSMVTLITEWTRDGVVRRQASREPSCSMV